MSKRLIAVILSLVLILSFSGCAKPTTPETPEAGTVSTPETPDTPDTPETPDTSETPETPDAPDTPDGAQDTESGGLPKSYREFSLTAGMSADEAYEYLNGFLSSKYSILLNKQHKVDSDYEPSDLVVPDGCDYKMERTAAAALEKMLAAAREDGIYDLVLYSGYRTYSSQKNKYESRTQRYINEGYSAEEAEKKAGEYIAPPGSSEHHTGLAADVCSSEIVSKFGYLDDSFDETDEYRWLSEHCSEYGFIMRYRREAEDITGFLYEPWHYRYLGVDHAKACTELGITYEEYHSLLEKLCESADKDRNK